MIASFLGCAALYLIFNYRRWRRLSFDLHPNCLITRHPIYFVSGEQSFFYHGRYFNQIPYFLREHGYEVHELQSIEALAKVEQRFHLVCIESDLQNSREFIKEIKDQVVSISMIEDGEDNRHYQPFHVAPHVIEGPSEPQNPGGRIYRFFWFIHKIWTQSRVPAHAIAAPGWNELGVAKAYLFHFIKIAERDWVEN